MPRTLGYSSYDEGEIVAHVGVHRHWMYGEVIIHTTRLRRAADDAIWATVETRYSLADGVTESSVWRGDLALQPRSAAMTTWYNTYAHEDEACRAHERAIDYADSWA